MPKEVLDMKTTIDRFGRIVVPKEMRRHFGLAPGACFKCSVASRFCQLKRSFSFNLFEIHEYVNDFRFKMTA